MNVEMSKPRLAGTMLVAGLVALDALVAGAPATALGSDNFSIPSSAQQLIVVSSRAYDPPGYLAMVQTFQRASTTSPWEPVFATWRAEIGSGDLVNVRHFGDHATSTGVFEIGMRMYGNKPNPGGLRYAYHQLVCGDWWDEDPYSPHYNQFVHVPCGTTPGFAAWSEALWTETLAYPYFAVLETNNNPTISGGDAPGAGIFLHHWMNAPTEGCVALPLADLLKVLRWLNPRKRPVIEIGIDAEVGKIPPPTASPQPAHRSIAHRSARPSAARRHDRSGGDRGARRPVAKQRIGSRSRRPRDTHGLGIAGGLLAALVAGAALVALSAVLTFRPGRGPRVLLSRTRRGGARRRYETRS